MGADPMIQKRRGRPVPHGADLKVPQGLRPPRQVPEEKIDRRPAGKSHVAEAVRPEGAGPNRAEAQGGEQDHLGPQRFQPPDELTGPLPGTGDHHSDPGQGGERAPPLPLPGSSDHGPMMGKKKGSVKAPGRAIESVDSPFGA